MRVLITHEESQTVMDAFLNAGHDAYSCDLLPASGMHPERHLQMDCFKAIELIRPRFAGMHPECTFLTSARNKYYAPKYDLRFPTQHEDRKKAIEHFKACVKVFESGEVVGYIENPIGIMSSIYRKPDQIIQPYLFGDAERKSTCLWLFGLPKLEPTNIVEPDIIVHKSGRTDSRLNYVTF